MHHLLGGGVPRACPPPSCTTCPACSPRPKARSGRISAETLRYCLPPADARPCLSMVGMKVAFLDSYVVSSCFSLPKIAMRCMASARVHELRLAFPCIAICAVHGPFPNVAPRNGWQKGMWPIWVPFTDMHDKELWQGRTSFTPSSGQASNPCTSL